MKGGWMGGTFRPSSLNQTGETYKIADTEMAARVLMHGTGYSLRNLSIAERDVLGNTYEDEVIWSRVTRLWQGVHSNPSTPIGIRSVVFVKPKTAPELDDTNIYVWREKDTIWCTLRCSTEEHRYSLITNMARIGPFKVTGVEGPPYGSDYPYLTIDCVLTLKHLVDAINLYTKEES